MVTSDDPRPRARHPDLLLRMFNELEHVEARVLPLFLAGVPQHLAVGVLNPPIVRGGTAPDLEDRVSFAKGLECFGPDQVSQLLEFGTHFSPS